MRLYLCIVLLLAICCNPVAAKNDKKAGNKPEANRELRLDLAGTSSVTSYNPTTNTISVRSHSDLDKVVAAIKGRDWMDYTLGIIQVLSLVALVVYVVKTVSIASSTQKSVEEMKKAREDAAAPYVIAYFDVDYQTQHFHLCIANVGKTVAEDVRVSFSPELTCSQDDERAEEDKLKNLPFLRNGLGSIAPGSGIRAFYDTAPGYFEDGKYPSWYKVKINYNDQEGKKHSKEQILDLSAYEGLPIAGEPFVTVNTTHFRA